MSSIIYKLDKDIIAFHAKRKHTNINICRVSMKIAFKDLEIGDFVFIVDKDNENKVLAYGRLNDIRLNSINFMWNKYEEENGFDSLNELKEYLTSKNKKDKSPATISSLSINEMSYLASSQDLNELNIGTKEENSDFSYINNSTTFELLKKIKKHLRRSEATYNHELMYGLFLTHDEIKEMDLKEGNNKKAYKFFKDYTLVNNEYSLVRASKNEIFKIEDNNITIMFYHEEGIDEKILYGQAFLYKRYIKLFCPKLNSINFLTSDRNETINKLINA